MRTCLVVTGGLFGLFAAMHFFIAWQHGRSATAESWVWPALIGLVSAALAAWAFRLMGRREGSRP